MNNQNITVRECEQVKEKENKNVILNDGKVVGFEEEPKKVLWFSRHKMTEEQAKALGDNVEIIQIDKSIQTAYELQEEINQCDIIAIVAPINLQEQFLKLAGDKPVITALNNRVLVLKDGESEVQFNFVKWERLIKIEVLKEDFKG